MSEYVKDAIPVFGEDVSKGVTTPAQQNIFEVDETPPRLDHAQAELFHTVVAKLLHVSKQGCPDIPIGTCFPVYQSVCEHTAGLGKTVEVDVLPQSHGR